MPLVKTSSTFDLRDLVITCDCTNLLNITSIATKFHFTVSFCDQHRRRIVETMSRAQAKPFYSQLHSSCFRFLSWALFFCSFLACTLSSWPSSAIFIFARRLALNTCIIWTVNSWVKLSYHEKKKRCSNRSDNTNLDAKRKTREDFLSHLCSIFIDISHLAIICT